MHNGETLFVNWFVPQRKILAAKLSCGMRPTTPRPNLELSATGHYFIDFDVTQSPDWTPQKGSGCEAQRFSEALVTRASITCEIKALGFSVWKLIHLIKVGGGVGDF